MAQGFLKGTLWGSAVALLAAGALSIATAPDRAEPPGADVADRGPAPNTAPQLGRASGPDAVPLAGAAADLPDEAAPAPPEMAVVAEPARPSVPGRRPPPEAVVDLETAQAPDLGAPQSPALFGADTAPLAPPDIGAMPQSPNDAPEVQDAPVVVLSDAPAQPQAQPDTPSLASPEARDPTLSPLQPPPPPIPGQRSALVADEDARVGEGSVAGQPLLGADEGPGEDADVAPQAVLSTGIGAESSAGEALQLRAADAGAERGETRDPADPLSGSGTVVAIGTGAAADRPETLSATRGPAGVGDAPGPEPAAQGTTARAAQSDGPDGAVTAETGVTDAPARSGPRAVTGAGEAVANPEAYGEPLSAETSDGEAERGLARDEADAPVPSETGSAGSLATTGSAPRGEDTAEPRAPEQIDDATADRGNAGPSAQEGPRPGIGEPAPSLLARGGAVTQTRLPRIGVPQQSAAARSDAPLVRYAAPTRAEAGAPRLSVVLIDEGAGPFGPEALAAFPFPLTVALAPGHPDPAAATEAYRALGFEIVALTSVPQGAEAADVEVTLSATLDAVPEAVAVLEAPGGALQANRDTAAQAADFLAASGHGLLMQPRGFNTARQIAAREGVPSATVFRDLDGEGQDERAIRRDLDQAAFRARQDGAVVMMGRLRADTLSALILWGLQTRTADLSLVPVSVILRETAPS